MTPQETKRALARRMVAKDLAGRMELIAHDAVYFWSNGQAMWGKAEIEAAMKSNFEQLQEDAYDVDQITWLAQNDDIAACIFRFKWTALSDGREVSGRGRGASVLKRQGGAWRIVDENLRQGSWRKPPTA